MADITSEQIVDYLSNLPVIQIAGLIKTLEDKWGVSAAAPVPPQVAAKRIEFAFFAVSAALRGMKSGGMKSRGMNSQA